MALKWIDIKKYLSEASQDILQTTVRCQEHHHMRYLTCYPIVRRPQETDLLCIVLNYDYLFRQKKYCAEELKLIETFKNRRMLYSELKQFVDIMLDDMLEKKAVALIYNEDSAPQIVEFNDEIIKDQESNIQTGFEEGYDPYQIEHEQQPILSLTI